jgi:DNA-binding GntR family transcriptional regulator
MNTDGRPPGASDEQVSRGSLRQQVTTRILTAVFQGRFRSGQRLVVQRLAELYEVSPTPVRESLVELAGIGIVDLLPNRGAVVRPFRPQEVRDISQVRRVLEVEAVRCACGQVDPKQLADLKRELTRLLRGPRDEQWDRDARAADTWLHGLIAESCGSVRLAAEIHRYLTLFRTLRDVSHQRDAWNHYARSDDIAEHLEIVRALVAADPEEAARAMDRHIRSAAKALEDVVFGAAPEPRAPRGRQATKERAPPTHSQKPR